MTTENSALLVLLVAGAVVLALDQGMKTAVVAHTRSQKGSGTLTIPGIRLCMNRAIAFGLVRDRDALFVLWCCAVLATVLLACCAPRFQTWTSLVGMGAALGGATSNALDWARRGAVIDFIDIRVGVFNIADVFIVLGVGGALWSAR